MKDMLAGHRVSVLIPCLNEAENLPFVLPYQLLKRRGIAMFGAIHQRYVWVDLFRRWGLDGWHRQKLHLRRLNQGRLRDGGRENAWR